MFYLQMHMDAISNTLTILVFAATLIALYNLRSLFSPSHQKVNEITINVYSKFTWIYGLISLADWIPNSYTFTFWLKAGFDNQIISYFYITSVVASLCTNLVYGKVLDKFGRKFGCLFYCFCASISNALRSTENPSWIAVGQIFAGIGNAALYTSFEAWLSGYYASKEMSGYTLTPIADIYAVNTLLSAVGAIFSGVMSYYLHQHLGDKAPFMASIALLVVPFWKILRTWPENTGQQVAWKLDGKSDKIADTNLLYTVGFTQLSVETCLNIVILIWTPTLAELFLSNPAIADQTLAKNEFPFGSVFSTMMAGLMLGSQLFQSIVKYGVTIRNILTICTMFAALAFLICYFSTVYIVNQSFYVTFTGLVLFELSFGMYMPAISMARSNLSQDEKRGQILNKLRIPINVVCILVYYVIGKVSLQLIYAFGFLVMLSAFLLLNAASDF